MARSRHGNVVNNKDRFDKTQIGEYLGREPDYQDGFSLKVLHAYVNAMDFSGLMFDDAIRFYLSGFRLPGEAQKVRIYEVQFLSLLARSLTLASSPFFTSVRED